MSERFPGESLVTQYFQKYSPKEWSYNHFLQRNRSAIVKLPPFSADWTGIDGAWQNRFLCVAKKIPAWEDSKWKWCGTS
ncbi:hypothetical protein BC936DRAFT_139564 [Jimgerdemannia flammicorona]|uniref:Uncharacterized protein n=1 Tax=Jimgerdemannia flammicorona TaxID=994334 RepID=A0A433B9M7_9FUNG|nr:hypothetical protein BC936DRAFT_139564 [Jimgerdemannia flammicorona]